MERYNLNSFFSGAGGLDTGFKNIGFSTQWANEYDKKIYPTFASNHPEATLDTRSIFDVQADELPDAVGFIGGPPCQSWSLGGLGKGLDDPRGQAFIKYLQLIDAKKPLFFLAENVKGMLAKSRKDDLDTLLKEMDNLGYDLKYKLLNAYDYGVPQDRQRVIFVGYHKSLNRSFTFPDPVTKKLTLKDSIWDLRNSASPAQPYDYKNCELDIPNHEYSTGSFSPQYMSRNRSRSWGSPSYTIQASGRQAPLHPDSGAMVKVAPDLYKFANDNFRRLSVREAARVQTFPDDYIFTYDKLDTGYKMIGNAVPVRLAEVLAYQIFTDLTNYYTGV